MEEGSESKGGDRGKNRSFIQLAKLSSVGLEMGVAVAVGWGIGYWLDTKLGTKPWLMLLFVLFGVAAGFKGVWLAASRASGQHGQPKG